MELTAFATRTIDDLAASSYETLRARQDGPWATVATGAGGAAYLLWRAGLAGDSAKLDAADALLRQLSSCGAEDYRLPNTPERPPALAYYGQVGTAVLRCLVADARGDSATYALELEHVEAAARALPGKDELLFGSAGLLNVVRVAYTQTADARWRAIAATIAAHLLTRVGNAVAGALSPASLGFGHGAAGILHALLAWAERSGGPAPDAVVRSLDKLGEAEDAGAFDPVDGTQRWMPGSFCAGSPGLALLWVKAHEVTGRPPFLERAEKHGLSILTAPAQANSNLCCGAAGRAYALLALDRVQPGRGWDERAAIFALSAVRAFVARPGQWSYGLFKGAPGIACLAQDLSRQRGARGGFPLVES